MAQTFCLEEYKTRKVENNDADMLLRVTQDEMSREKNDEDLLLRVRQNKKSREKNGADLLQ